MDGLQLICVDIIIDSTDQTKLQMMINKQQDQVWNMWHYHHDVWCQLPDTYDDCLSRGVSRSHWFSFLISFIRDTGEVKKICWKLDGVDVFFTRA